MIRSRRRILVGGGLAAGLAALGVELWRPRPDPVALLAQRVVGLFPEIAAAAPAVRASASFARWGSDRAALAQAIVGPALGRLASEPAAATLDALADAVERDFQQDRLALVDGWILAETEVRLIAFIAHSGVA